MNIQRIREVVSYCPETGIFTNLVKRGCIAAGSQIGSDNGEGYLRFSIDKVDYFAHRIAWALVHGHIPAGMVIDHINGNRSDNRIQNLRLTDVVGNARNSAAKPGKKTSRYRGVKFAHKKWEAWIRDGSKQRYLGRFETEVEAAKAYDAASRELHGEFGRRNFQPTYLTISSTMA